MELTPRETPAAPPRRRRLPYLVVVAVVAALGFVVVQGLSNATLYFYNADEAVARHDDLDGRFRLQGDVEEGSVETVGDQVHFAVTHGGATVRVEHFGDPPELFQPGIPVVLEGRWADGSGNGDPVFASDRILVKHSSEYQAENPDRVDEYDDPGDDPVDVDEAP